MPYLYQSTHVANLPSIKQHGLAPLVKRPAGIAQGATARDRAANEESKREGQVLRLLFTCFMRGIPVERVVADSGADIALAPVTITGAIDYSFPQAPGRTDIIELDRTTDDYLKRYCERLGAPDPEQRQFLRENKIDTIVKFRDKFCTLARAFESVMPQHFITRLALRYTRTYYDAEFRITSENIYFFRDADFAKGYAGYAHSIANGVVENLAILRVDEVHCGELKPDSAQGSAWTSKNVVPAEHIAYTTGIPVPTAVSGEVFKDGYWNRLSKYTG